MLFNENDKEKVFEDLRKLPFHTLGDDEKETLVEHLLDSFRNKDFLHYNNSEGYEMFLHIMMSLEGIVGEELVPVDIENLDRMITIEEIEEKVGHDKIVEGLIEMFTKGSEMTAKMTDEELEDIANQIITKEEKEENIQRDLAKGIISEEQAELLRRSNFTTYHKRMDVGFTAFAIVNVYSAFLKGINKEKNANSDEKLIDHAEPVALATLAYMLSATITASNDNSLKKTFEKHGLAKTLLSIGTTEEELTKMIVDYGMQNHLHPEKVAVALMKCITQIVQPLNLSLDNITNQEDFLARIILALSDPDTLTGIDDELKQFIKNGSSEEVKEEKEIKKSKGSNPKKKQTKKDIREMLLDD